MGNGIQWDEKCPVSTALSEDHLYHLLNNLLCRLMAHCLQNSTKLLKKLREQREKREKKERKKERKKEKKGEKSVMTMQKISLFTFTEIVPSPSRSKRPNAARISCSFAPENLFFVILLFLLPLYLELALIFSWKVLRSLRSSPNFLFVLQDDSLCSLTPSGLVLTSHVNNRQLTICVGWGCGSAAGVGTMWHQSARNIHSKRPWVPSDHESLKTVLMRTYEFL